MYRRHIHAVCNCSAHFGPVRMRYGGYKYRRGMRVHVMYCPFSGLEQHFIYRFGIPQPV